MTKFELAIKKAAPIILTILGCSGVVGTAVLAVKNQKKYEEDIKEKTTNTFYSAETGKPYAEFEGEELPGVEKAKIFVKDHATTLLVGGASMLCIVGSNALTMKQNAGLISAYGLVSESFREYRNKLIELDGPEKHQQILNEIAAEKAEPPYICSYGAFSSPSLDATNLSKNDHQQLFYDEYSRRYFTSTLAEVIQAEYHINRNYCLGAVVLTNEWYNFLGLPTTTDGNETGWYLGCEDDFMWLDFNHTVAHLDDETPYISIGIELDPVLLEEMY